MFTVSRTLVIAVLVLGVMIAVALRKDSGRTPEAVSPLAASHAVVPAGRASAPPRAAVPRLVDVGADKCIPCKAMVPVLDALRREYAGSVQVEFIDAWKYPEQAEPYKVYGIPTQIFVDPSGRELHRHLGFISKEEILETWRKLGYPLTAIGKG